MYIVFLLGLSAVWSIIPPVGIRLKKEEKKKKRKEDLNGILPQI